MKSWIRRGLALAAALVLAAPAAAQQGPPAGDAPAEKPAPAEAPAQAAKPSKQAPQASGPPTWFALTLAHSEIGINVAYFWSKGPKLRTETVIAGHRVVNLVNGDTYYAYDAVTRRGVAIGRSKLAREKDAQGRRPFGRELEVIRAQGGEKVGEEKLGGRLCERWRVTDAAGRREIWVTKDELRLPVRVESYTRATGKTIATEFLNWASELPIDDRFFEPEAGIELQRLTFEQYAARQFTPIGPVPVLYMDLLTGR